MARPVKVIDQNLLLELARIHCTLEEMETVLDISRRTLKRSYAHLIAKGTSEGKMTLRRAQFKSALGGNIVMQIWLGKQCLGQKERVGIDPGELIKQIPITITIEKEPSA